MNFGAAVLKGLSGRVVESQYRAWRYDIRTDILCGTPGTRYGIWTTAETLKVTRWCPGNGYRDQGDHASVCPHHWVTPNRTRQIPPQQNAGCSCPVEQKAPTKTSALGLEKPTISQPGVLELSDYVLVRRCSAATTPSPVASAPRRRFRPCGGPAQSRTRSPCRKPAN